MWNSWSCLWSSWGGYLAWKEQPSQLGNKRKVNTLHPQRPVLMFILRQGDSANTKSRFVTQGHTWCAYTLGGVPDVLVWLAKCLRKTVRFSIIPRNILQIFIALKHCLTFTSVQTQLFLYSCFFQCTGLFFIPVTISVFFGTVSIYLFCYYWPYLGFTL